MRMKNLVSVLFSSALALCTMFGSSCVFAAETVTYYYTNEQGTPIAATDASGNIVTSADHRPYGTQALGAPTQGPGFTGHVHDIDAGLLYMQARYYDPDVGRFLSVDPQVPRPGAINAYNRYSYANNNPVRFTDPSGMCGVSGDVSPEVQRMRDLSDKCAGTSSGSSLTRPSADSGSVTMQNTKDNNSHQDCGSSDSCMTGEAIATTLGKIILKKAIVDRYSPASLRPWFSVVGRALSAGNKAKAWGTIAADINDRTFTSAIEDIKFKQAIQLVGPTGRGYPASLINWGRVDWGPYDSPEMDLEPGKVFFNFATGVRVSGTETGNEGSQ